MNTKIDLGGRVVAFSFSPPNDLRRLGFPDKEIERIVEAFCVRIVRANGRVLYGGNLREGNFTARMYDFVSGAYASTAEAGKPKPFLHFLPRPELAATPFDKLRDYLTTFAASVETHVVMSKDTHVTLVARENRIVVRGRGAPIEKLAAAAGFENFITNLPPQTKEEGFTLMRNAQRAVAAARIVIGGKRGDLGVAKDADRYQGAMPGIYEEALTTFTEGKPMVVLAAYGGAARDLSIDLELIDAGLETPYLGPTQKGYGDAREAMRACRDKLSAPDRQAMAGFALREDAEALARDATAWIASRLAAPA